MARLPRKRHNRFVRVLAELYELDYYITLSIYRRFDQCIGATKMHLNRIESAGHELDHINEINLAY